MVLGSDYVMLMQSLAIRMHSFKLFRQFIFTASECSVDAQ